MKTQGSFLFAMSPLSRALEQAGYHVYQSADKRYCWLPQPTDEFNIRPYFGNVIHSLLSPARCKEYEEQYEKGQRGRVDRHSDYQIGRGGKVYSSEFLEMFPYTYGSR